MSIAPNAKYQRVLVLALFLVLDGVPFTKESVGSTIQRVPKKGATLFWPLP